MQRRAMVLVGLTLLYGYATQVGAVTPTPAINMAGTWQFSLVASNQTTPVYTGQLVQVGNNVSGFQPFATSGSGCSNTVTVIGTVTDTGILTLNITAGTDLRVMTGTVSADGNSASGTFTSNPGGCLNSISGTWTGTRAHQVLPQFAFGGGWYSALYFTNMGTSPASFTVNFTGDDGTPLNVAPVGGSSAIVNLAPLGTAIVEAPNVGNLSEGSVLLSLPGGVVGYGIFRQSVPGVPDQEAVVPLSGTSVTKSRLIWDDTNFTTAVAIVNPSSTNLIVAIVVRDSQGNSIGTSSVALGPNAKKAVVLRSLSGLGAMAGNRGSADFTVGAGNVAVLGLRFSGSAFTSIPTADQ